MKKIIPQHGKIINSIILLIMILILFSCTPTSYTIKEPELLRKAIAQQTQIPFTAYDTVVIEDFIGICGNSPYDEIKDWYEPHLYESPYREIIQQQYHGKLIFSNDTSFQVQIETTKPPSHYTESRHYYMRNKIDGRISGKIKNPNQVDITEIYTTKDSICHIHKSFLFKNNKWGMKDKNHLYKAN